MSDNIQITIGATGAGQVSREFTEIDRAAGRAQDTLEDFGVIGGVDTLLGRLKDTRNELGNLRDAADGVSGFGARLSALGVAGGAALVGGLKMSLDAFGETQQVKMGFESMLGSQDAAEEMFQKVQKFAETSPFDFTESAKATQKLLAMGFAAEEIIPTLNSVGNAVAAAGGTTEDFSGVLTALGQIRTKGKVSQEELNQITERGVSVQFLADKLGLTAEQMGDIGNQGIKADRAIKALTEGFGDLGGGTAMAKQMETIPGQMSSLGDSAKQAAAAVGEVFSEDASDLIENATDLLNTIKGIAQQNPELVRTLATIVGIGAVGAVTVGGGLIVGGALVRGATDILGVVKAMRQGKSAAKDAADAKRDLLGATLADTVAEKNKAAVAGIESDAIADTAEAARDAAGAKDTLADSTKKASRESGLLARARGVLARNVNIPGVGGRSVGQLGGAAAAGAFAGWGIADSLKNNTGMDDGAANLLGGASGLAVGALTVMAPQAILPMAAGTAIAKAIEFGVNKAYNEPLEKAAAQGTGADATDIMGKDMSAKLKAAQDAVNKGGDRRQLADVYNEMAAKSREAGDDVSAESFMNMALSQRKLGNRENAPGSDIYWDAQRKRADAWLAQNGVKSSGGPGASISNANSAARSRNATAVRPTMQTIGDVQVEVRVVRGETQYERDAREYGATRRSA